MKKRKIAVAVSGGVDSGIALLLLSKKGFDCTAFYMDLWREEGGKFDDNSLKVAQETAEKLKIPFKVVNFKEIFKKKVVDYFLESYNCGLTPNPCVRCNKLIKFGKLLDFVLSQGFDYLATGHYARLKKDKKGYCLFAGIDKSKDQSYFLYDLSPKQLAHLAFPLGNYFKREVIELAKKWNLPVVNRAESQEICFIKGGDYRDFLKKHLKKNFKEGKVVDTKGKVIGYHLGLSLYTIGQRHGFTINKAQTPNLPPFYVVAKNQKDNQLVVGFGKETERKGFLLRNVNWINPAEFKKGIFKTKLRVRYQGELLEAEIKENNKEDNLLVFLEEPERGIASGQSVVFYNKDEILGGGIIDIDKMDKRCLNDSSMT